MSAPRRRSCARPFPKTIATSVTSIFLAVVFAPALGAGDWYVDDDGDCTNGDGTHGNPYCLIQDAIDAASHGDTVHIAAGTYLESLTVDKDLALIGEEGDRVTTVDASYVDRVLFLTAGATAEVTGLELTGGAAFDRSPGYGGGGVLVESSCSLMAHHCTLRDNWSYSGGGILVETTATLVLTGSSLIQNLALWGIGGGLANEGTATLEDCTIRENLAEGPECYGDGGGISSGRPSEDGGTTILKNCSVIGNVLRCGCGSGIVVWGGILTLIDSEVCGNGKNGLSDAGLCNYDGHVTLLASVVAHNEVGIYNVRGELILANSSVVGNKYRGIFNYRDGLATLTHCTVAGNLSDHPGAGIHNQDGGSVTLSHTIVAKNRAPTDPDCRGTLVSEGYNLIGDTGGCTLTGDGTGNLLDVDPRFDVHWPRLDDPCFPVYTLRPSSPCIDAGDPSRVPTGMDLRGNPRLLDGDLDRVMVVDMGAHEFGHTELTITRDPIAGTRQRIAAALDGTAGLQGYLFVGTDPGEIHFPPFGALFLDLSSPWRLYPVGALPATKIGHLPPNGSGLSLVFQGLGVQIGNGAGNLSNMVSERL